MINTVKSSMNLASETNANSTSASMLKKSLDFQGDVANTLINSSVNVADNQLKTESMQKLGIGQKLNITA